MVGDVGDAETCHCGDACLELGYGVRALVGDVQEAFEALTMNMRHSEAHAHPCHLDDTAANLYYSGLHTAPRPININHYPNSQFLASKTSKNYYIKTPDKYIKVSTPRLAQAIGMQVVF